LKPVLNSIGSSFKLLNVAVLFLNSRVPPTLSTTMLEKPATLRISKRKPDLQKPSIDANEDLRKREEDANAGAKKRVSLPPPPKVDGNLDPANALAEAVPNPLDGEELTPKGADENADDHR